MKEEAREHDKDKLKKKLIYSMKIEEAIEKIEEQLDLLRLFLSTIRRLKRK